MNQEDFMEIKEKDLVKHSYATLPSLESNQQGCKSKLLWIISGTKTVPSFKKMPKLETISNHGTSTLFDKVCEIRHLMSLTIRMIWFLDLPILTGPPKIARKCMPRVQQTNTS